VVCLLWPGPQARGHQPHNPNWRVNIMASYKLSILYNIVQYKKRIGCNILLYIKCEPLNTVQHF